MRLTDAPSDPRSLEPRQFKRLVRRANLPPLLLLTALAGVLLWQVSNLLDAHRAVEHSNRVIQHVDNLGDQLLAMQSGLRAYAVTAKPETLEVYDRGRLTLETYYARLLEEVSDNREQRLRVQGLRAMIDRWQEFADASRVRLLTASNSAAPTRANSGSRGASQPTTSPSPRPASTAAVYDLFVGQGKQLMDEIQVNLNGVLAAETTIRDTRSLAVRRSAAFTVIGGGTMALVLGLALAILARRQMVAVAATYDHALDVARQRTSEVQRNEALLRLITNTLPSLVAFIDADQRYRFTNLAYESYRGIGSDQVEGRHVRDVVGAQAYERIRPHIERVLRGRHIVFDTLVNFPRTGPREVHVEYMPHLDTASGKVTGFVSLISDITERNQSQRELQRSEERYRTFVRQSSEGIWRFELNEPIAISAPLEQQIELLYKHAYFAECNDAMARMYGLDRAEQIIGARLGDLLVREDPTNVAYLKSFVHSGYRLAEGESVERDAHGNTRFFLNNLVGFIEDGKLIRAWGTQRDITDRKKAEDERDGLLERERAARSEAERAGRVKDEFLSTLSHELRTPLNAILGWAQLLRREEVNEADLRQGLETIERNSRMQAQLIDDLLDMSRILAGKVRLEVSRVEVLGVIDAAIDTVRHAADAKGVKLYKHANALAEVSVQGDPNRLQQMIWNLLSNAIKFTPSGGRVDVTLSRFGEQVEITVADSGAGIDVAFLPYVFERFRQADSSSTRQHGGLGLGLSIVRQMAEMHGGTVHAHSDGPGHGATFRILLPVCSLKGDGSPAASDETQPKTRPREHAAPSTVDPTALSGVRVLVVDDEPDALDLLSRQLAECDAEVFAAATADDALRMIADVQPHVLVSDIGIPEHDGLWLIAQIRLREVNSGGHLPAVALTAFARPEDRERALESGYEHHLPKPAELSELVMLVAALAGPKLSGSR